MADEKPNLSGEKPVDAERGVRRTANAALSARNSGIESRVIVEVSNTHQAPPLPTPPPDTNPPKNS